MRIDLQTINLVKNLPRDEPMGGNLYYHRNNSTCLQWISMGNLPCNEPSTLKICHEMSPWVEIYIITGIRVHVCNG
jgi:hypothetical protein